MFSAIVTTGYFFIRVSKPPIKVVKKKYRSALRRSDKVEAIEWGKKYYGHFRPNRKATRGDVERILRDFERVRRGKPVY